VLLQDRITGKVAPVAGARGPVAAAGSQIAWYQGGQVVVAQLPGPTVRYRAALAALAEPGPSPRQAGNLLLLDRAGDALALIGNLAPPVAYLATPETRQFKLLSPALTPIYGNSNAALAGGRIVVEDDHYGGNLIVLGDTAGHVTSFLRTSPGSYEDAPLAGGVDTDGERVAYAQGACDGAVIQVRPTTRPSWLAVRPCPLVFRHHPLLKIDSGGSLTIDPGVVCEEGSLQPCDTFSVWRGPTRLADNGLSTYNPDGTPTLSPGLTLVTARGARLLRRHPGPLRVRIKLNRGDRTGTSTATRTLYTTRAAKRALRDPARFIP